MKKNKVIAGALASAVALGIATPVFADVLETQNAGSTVTYNGDSTYTVSIPKSIVLDTTTKTGTYEVSTSGDLAAKYYIDVTPASTFVMSQTGKDDVTATVTQDVTRWTSETIGTTTTGTITATGLSAGNWTGSLTFTIDLVEDEVSDTPAHDVVTQVNGKTSKLVHYIYNSSTAAYSFSYTGTATLIGWEFPGMTEEGDYSILYESADLTEIEIQIINGYEGEVIANAIVEE